MNRYRLASPIVALLIVAQACGGEGKVTDETSAVSGSPAGTNVGANVGTNADPAAGGTGLRWRNETYRELDGDEENAERLVATVSGGPFDSAVVRLEIRTSKDRILYRDEWPAVSYMKYEEPGSAGDSMAVLRETERQMARIFGDSAFIRGADTPVYTGSTDANLDAIRHDIAEHEYRAAKSLELWEPLPPGAHDEISTRAPAVPLARIRAVANDTRAMPAFKYYAGGEENYVIAWSASERRLVRIAACC